MLSGVELHDVTVGERRVQLWVDLGEVCVVGKVPIAVVDKIRASKGQVFLVVFQVLPAAANCSAIVMPSVVVDAGYEATPSRFISQGGPLTSLEQSRAGVAASVPEPAMGQIGLAVCLGIDHAG